MEKETAINALLALAQSSRLAIFRTLIESGPEGISAGKIGERNQIAASSVSFHLKELVKAGMASARKEGRFIIYTGNFDRMNALLVFLMDHCCGGNLCLTTTSSSDPAKYSTPRPSKASAAPSPAQASTSYWQSLVDPSPWFNAYLQAMTVWRDWPHQI